MLASVTIGDFVTTFLLGGVVGLLLASAGFFYLRKKSDAKTPVVKK